MSADAQRLPLPEAERLAAEALALLEGACERIAVAGSIRRRKADVGDVELVCVPRYEMRTEQVDMFTTRSTRVDLLHERCRMLLEAGILEHRPDKNGRPSFGTRAKRLVYGGFPLDVFSVVEPAQWGCVFLIRTGPAEFGRQLVLKRSAGGWLPRGFFFRDGQLWRLPPPFDADLVDEAEPIATPEEDDVFRALGYAWVPPEERAGDRRPPPFAELGPI